MNIYYIANGYTEALVKRIGLFLIKCFNSSIKQKLNNAQNTFIFLKLGSGNVKNMHIWLPF